MTYSGEPSGVGTLGVMSSSVAATASAVRVHLKEEFPEVSMASTKKQTWSPSGRMV